jgi:hypothetical protein
VGYLSSKEAVAGLQCFDPAAGVSELLLQRLKVREKWPTA